MRRTFTKTASLLASALFLAGALALPADAQQGSGKGPGDGTGNQGVGPKDGTGFGAGSGRRSGACTGSGPLGSRGSRARQGGRS